MLRATNGMIAIATGMILSGHLLSANEYLYQDDDLLCGPGFSPESYYQKIQQHEYQQMTSDAQQRYAAVREAAAEEQAFEKRKNAHRVAVEKEARRKEEIIARRKAENTPKNVAKVNAIKVARKTTD